MRFVLKTLATALVIGLALPGTSAAQGGGASSTGTIQGRVSDSSGAVLPGVTVTASSPSMIATQTQVSNETGSYRFPAVPPGVYELSFELAGFNTVKRGGIQVSLGFTANVNAELALATLQETVTVSGASPVIDTTATRVQQNFKLEQLNSIPNGRDMWALLAATPGVIMSRIDVGGNRAGTQTGYTAYGLNGQVRTSVEGINTTEGTGSAGFYYDYGSFEEVFMGVAGQGAEAATPGVQSNFLGKSGGNRFGGDFYIDGYNNSFQSSNLSEIYTKPTSQGGYGFREGSNEVLKYYDVNFNVGGPIKKDKAWFNFSWRRQFNSVEQPLFKFDQSFDTWNQNPSAKVTYQLNQKNKIIGYYQWNMKEQPNRLPFSTYTYDNANSTTRQVSPSWVYKAEWNGTLSDRIYVEARWGDFGYYDPRYANSDEDYFWRDSTLLVLTGAHSQNQTDRDRKQATGAATYFLDTRHGSHTFKFGGEIYNETQWGGREQNVGGNIEHIYSNGVASQVIFGIPTATCVCGRYASDNGQLLVVNNLDQQDLFLNDTWSMGRVTLNMGVRWDRYHGWMPEQEQMAFAIGPVSVPEQTFPETHFFTWNNVGPRIGVTYDLGNNGKTVIKASYGLFWHNPGPGVSADANPNQNNKSVTYTWTDRNGDRHYQLGEESANPTSTTLAGTIQLDPNITSPYSHDATVYVERQVSPSLGARVGFVYKTEDDLIAQYNPGRPIDAYTVPYNVVDAGVDGITGTADDSSIRLLGVPNTPDVNTRYPLTNVTMNTPRFSRYKTFEASMQKRLSNRWSAQIGGSHTWAHDFPGNYPNNPNVPFDEDTTRWDFKLSGTYEAPYGLRVSPLVRHQAGANFARQLTVGAGLATAAGAIFNGTINVEPLSTNRHDNITVFDVRIDRGFNLPGGLKVRGIFDMFNITNSNAAETRTITTGTAYLRPTAVLAPRTMRIGARVNF
ncbi:MAG TPA: carboxypeptidase regulatory-like domain-containing protein [Vicinamibacterales bacterium]|nr:carboxypeptidase regulatory-like domain-containing protein [Vicinamibacterales bacterium]